MRKRVRYIWDNHRKPPEKTRSLQMSLVLEDRREGGAHGLGGWQLFSPEPGECLAWLRTRGAPGRLR